jgi:hypothetical protein
VGQNVQAECMNFVLLSARFSDYAKEEMDREGEAFTGAIVFYSSSLRVFWKMD